MIETRFRKFRIGDIFEQERGKESAPNKVPDGNIPMINEISSNNGVAKFGMSNHVFKGNAITVSVNYAKNVFYQPNDFCASVNILILRNEKLNEKSGLYIASLLSKNNEKYSYTNKISRDKLNNTEILLPIKTSPTIDFLKLQSLAENVRGGGLDMLNIDTSSWKEFRLDELFESFNGDVDIQKKHINGKGIYVISAGEAENGIIGKTNVTAKIFPANTITVDMFGNAYYRDFEYKMVTHARVFSLKAKKPLTKEQGLFFATLIAKHKENFSFNNMCCWNKIKQIKLKLPVTYIEEIDYEYMEDLIKKFEKERIRELEDFFKVSGLNDYELTKSDEEILAFFRASFSERNENNDKI